MHPPTIPLKPIHSLFPIDTQPTTHIASYHNNAIFQPRHCPNFCPSSALCFQSNDDSEQSYDEVRALHNTHISLEQVRHPVTLVRAFTFSYTHVVPFLPSLFPPPRTRRRTALPTTTATTLTTTSVIIPTRGQAELDTQNTGEGDDGSVKGKGDRRSEPRTLEEAGPLKVLYRKHDLLVIDKVTAGKGWEGRKGERAAKTEKRERKQCK